MFAATFSLIFALCDLGQIFSQPESWDQSSKDFAKSRSEDGFVRMDDAGTQVSCLGKGKCAWFSHPLWESRVYFDNDGVKRVEMSLYNRGDAAGNAVDSVLSFEDLKTIVTDVSKKIDPAGKPVRTEKRENRSGGTQSVRRWEKLNPSVELMWGLAQDKTVDFIRLVLIRKGDLRKQSSGKSVSGAQAAKKVKVNIRKDDSGNVWIDNIPMVDQGQKGYCAVAVSERVLRYYGNDIDEHQIAQMAGSTAERGTSNSEMIETVKVLGSKFRLGFNQIFSSGMGMGEIKKDLQLYNKAAKRLKRPTLRFDDFMQGNCFNAVNMQSVMESDVILEMRQKDPRFKKFLKDVKMRIDQGIPVFWGVTLGIFPEPECPQASGGHMRLIIGYNSATGEILFSDTWGANHALKRMDETKAFAITTNAFTLRPL